MTLKLTERDKKLLAVLAAFVLVVGAGIGVVFPLMEKGQELKEEVSSARIEQQERRQKVESLPVLQKKETSITSDIEEIQQDFNPIMKSLEIDKLLTEQALAKGITIKNMEIKMPVSGEYTVLEDYSEYQEEEDNQDEEGITYDGVYTTRVELTFQGSREAIQSVMDVWAAKEPGMRITDFTWQTDQDSGSKTLGMTLEIYMCQDIEQYIQEQEAAREAAAAEEQTDGTAGSAEE